MGIVGNYFIKSERIHLQQAKLSTLGEKQKERLLKGKRKIRVALEKHRNSPVRSLLFILLILGAGIAIGSLGLFEKMYPPDPSEAQNSGALIFSGVLISIGAVWAIVLVVRKVIRKQWTPEIDLVIAKLEAEIRQLEKDIADARPLSSED